jgi:hypothetical protein
MGPTYSLRVIEKMGDNRWRIRGFDEIGVIGS